MNANPTLAAQAALNSDMQGERQKMEAMRRNLNAQPAPDKKAKLREACEGFESVFIQKMWEQMRATVPDEGLMHSKDEKLWQSMYDQELSKKMAGAGGIGLADMMMSQLDRNLGEPAKPLDTSVGRREPMSIQPVPLLPEGGKTAQVAQKSTPEADLYSGSAPVLAAVPDDTAAPNPPDAFGDLVGRLQAEMQQPAVVTTRITTNASSLASFGNTRGIRAGRKNVPRMEIDKTPQPVNQPADNGLTARPQAATGPSVSPGAVDEKRTAMLDPAPANRR